MRPPKLTGLPYSRPSRWRSRPRGPAPPAPAYGKIVSQTFDKAQNVTETHLANGLTILSKEVHAAPVVYFSVWYKVGSRNEISGQTGLSHILEHMMFKGTQGPAARRD